MKYWKCVAMRDFSSRTLLSVLKAELSSLLKPTSTLSVVISRGLCFTMLDLSLAGSDQPSLYCSLLSLSTSLQFFFLPFKRCPGLQHIPLHLVVLVLVRHVADIHPGLLTLTPIQTHTGIGILTTETEDGQVTSETASHTTMEDEGEAAVLLLIPTRVCYFFSHDTTTFDDVCSVLVGRKRRRSMSPYDRERYDPRPRYDDYGLLLLSHLVSFSVSHPICRFSFAFWIFWVSASTFGTLQKGSAS
jgi:hypothetical protein